MREPQTDRSALQRLYDIMVFVLVHPANEPDHVHRWFAIMQSEVTTRDLLVSSVDCTARFLRWLKCAVSALSVASGSLSPKVVSVEESPRKRQPSSETADRSSSQNTLLMTAEHLPQRCPPLPCRAFGKASPGLSLDAHVQRHAPVLRLPSEVCRLAPEVPPAAS